MKKKEERKEKRGKKGRKKERKFCGNCRGRRDQNADKRPIETLEARIEKKREKRRKKERKKNESPVSMSKIPTPHRKTRRKVTYQRGESLAARNPAECRCMSIRNENEMKFEKSCLLSRSIIIAEV